MSKIIKSTSVFITVVLLCLSVSLSGQGLANAANNKTENIRALISSHIDQEVSNQDLIAFLETTEENLNMLIEIRDERKSDPSFVSEDLDALIEGMRRKLDDDK